MSPVAESGWNESRWKPSFFTIEDAARFRAMARKVAAEHGRQVTVHAAHVVDDAGNEFGLWNLATMCAADEDRTQWRVLMATHFDRLFNPQCADLDAMDEATLLAGVLARLVAEDSLPWDAEPDADSLDRWAPGIRRILALDTPTTVLTVPLTEFETRAPRAVLVDQCWRNTRALLDAEELVADRVEHDGRWFTCILGDSLFLPASPSCSPMSQLGSSLTWTTYAGSSSPSPIATS